MEEVVDLTCEGSDSTVVDLTNNDSVLVKHTHRNVCTCHQMACCELVVDQ